MAINKGDSTEVEIVSVLAGVTMKQIVTAVNLPRPSKERVDQRVQQRNRSIWTTAFEALEPSFAILAPRNQLQALEGKKVLVRYSEILTEEALADGADKVGWDEHQYTGILSYQPSGEFSQGEVNQYRVSLSDVDAYALKMGTIANDGTVSHVTAEHWAPDKGIWFQQTADEAVAGSTATTNRLLGLWRASGETTTPVILGDGANLPLT